MKIEDNFLDQKEFDKLQTHIMGLQFAWFFTPYIVDENDKNEKEFQFIHMFYIDNAPCSPFCQKLNPILNKLNALALTRIKANLLTRTPNIVENEFHIDMENVTEEKLKQWTTSIFYMNTNNGYTKFEDGTQVESVANRFISFSANNRHSGSTCTDQKRRVVINFNYYN